MASFHATYEQYCEGNTTEVLRTGPGSIYAIIATSEADAPEQVEIYDNTAASGELILIIKLWKYSPAFILQLPNSRPIKFFTGLTVVTPVYSSCHLTLMY